MSDQLVTRISREGHSDNLPRSRQGVRARNDRSVVRSYGSLEAPEAACRTCVVPNGPKSSSRDRSSSACASCSRVLRGGLGSPFRRLSIGFHDIPTCSANPRMLIMPCCSICPRITVAIRATASERARSRAKSEDNFAENGTLTELIKLQWWYSTARDPARQMPLKGEQQ